MRRRIKIPVGQIVFVLLAMVTAVAQAQEKMVQLRGNIPPIVGKAIQAGRLSATNRLRFSITLPPRNQPEMDALFERMYTPGDPNYHHFLKTGEFAERFGPAQSNYDAVITFAKKLGLDVVQTHANRLVLEVAGPTDKIEKGFGIRMMHYRTANGRVFHAPDSEPTVPAEMADKISGIVGLDDALEPLSNLLLPPSANAGGSPNAGSGPAGGYTPSDIKTAYNLNGLPENGSGQTIALFELDGYLTSDVLAYEANYSLPNVTIQNVLLDGVSGNPSALTNAGPLEVTLDVELAIALSPNISQLIVYEGTSFVNIYNRIASDNFAQQVSTSWYSGRDIDVSSSITNGEFFAFKQMAMQGQTLYAASGDFGDKVKTGTDTNGNPVLKFGVQDPSAQPYVTGVGGTTLTTAGAGGTNQSETTWAGSGGGISPFWTLPNYQSALVSPGSSGSSTLRNVPDVSLCSDPNSPYSVYYNGAWTTVGGTSCAAPLWAGYTALINQRRANAGTGRLGFLNPTLYYLGHSENYNTDFYDITNGNNGTYAAVSHYDNTTGWGSFKGGTLINDLQLDANVLYVDGSYAGATENGTIAAPYKTITGAINSASQVLPTLIYIKGQTYHEYFTTSKKCILVNNSGGTVTIGN